MPVVINKTALLTDCFVFVCLAPLSSSLIKFNSSSSRSINFPGLLDRLVRLRQSVERKDSARYVINSGE